MYDASRVFTGWSDGDTVMMETSAGINWLKMSQITMEETLFRGFTNMHTYVIVGGPPKGHPKSLLRDLGDGLDGLGGPL
jgi:hypothetical protein